MPRTTIMTIAVVLAAGLPVDAQSGSDEAASTRADSVRKKLDAAKGIYEQEMEKIKKAVLKAFEQQEASARKAGNKDRVDRVIQQRELYETEGDIPADMRDVFKRLTSAQKAMLSALKKAESEFTKLGLDGEADEAEKLIESMTRDHHELTAKQAPIGEFKPPISRKNTNAWIIGDPSNAAMTENGVLLSAGPEGNFLVTKKNDFRATSLKVEIAAARGTEAYLGLRVVSDEGKLTGLSSGIFDMDGQVRAGMFGCGFNRSEAGPKRVAVDYEKMLKVRFIVTEDRNGAVRVNDQPTGGIAYRERDCLPQGAAGVFVKSGAVLIRSMVVDDSVGK